MKKIIILFLLLAGSIGSGFFLYDRAEAQRALGAIRALIPPTAKPLPPEQYGNIILKRYAERFESIYLKPVVFPHWFHRMRFTCKVCHSDIGFTMKVGADDIKMNEIFEGEWCGRCHNGKVAFAPLNCSRCHSLGREIEENRKPMDFFAKLPQDPYGNTVDWVAAIREGAVEPRASIDGDEAMVVFDMDIELVVGGGMPPNVIFPHKAHTEWLHCNSCHPSPFIMKKGGNDYTMLDVLEGRYCGVCHNRVAFPFEDCFRCHSGKRI